MAKFCPQGPGFIVWDPDDITPDEVKAIVDKNKYAWVGINIGTGSQINKALADLILFFTALKSLEDPIKAQLGIVFKVPPQESPKAFDPYSKRAALFYKKSGIEGFGEPDFIAFDLPATWLEQEMHVAEALVTRVVAGQIPKTHAFGFMIDIEDPTVIDISSAVGPTALLRYFCKRFRFMMSKNDGLGHMLDQVAISLRNMGEPMAFAKVDNLSGRKDALDLILEDDLAVKPNAVAEVTEKEAQALSPDILAQLSGNDTAGALSNVDESVVDEKSPEGKQEEDIVAESKESEEETESEDLQEEGS